MLDLVNKSQEAVVDVSKQILKQNSFAMKLEGKLSLKNGCIFHSKCLRFRR